MWPADSLIIPPVRRDSQSTKQPEQLRYFDQIMCEYRLWGLVHDLSYRRNLEDVVIDESEEHILNIDNIHLRGYSTPGKYIKECRECELAEDCEDKVSTDETADWYIKGKYKCYYAHQIGVSQLADSGASPPSRGQALWAVWY